MAAESCEVRRRLAQEVAPKLSWSKAASACRQPDEQLRCERELAGAMQERNWARWAVEVGGRVRSSWT